MQTSTRTKTPHPLAVLFPLLLSAAGLSAIGPCAAATIVADFTGGTGTADASHQFTGVPGDGWKTAWSTAQTDATLTTSVTNEALSVSIAGGANAARSSLNRAYENSGDNALIDTTKAYTLSFSLTFTDLTKFSASNDYFGIFETPAAIAGSAVGGVTNSWAFQIPGGSKKLQWGNGNQDASQAVTYIDSGIVIQTGVTYTFTISVNPDGKNWETSIAPSNTSTVYTSGLLNFRSTADNLGSNGRYFHINTLANTDNANWAYTLDGLTISQIPEPRAAAFLGGLGALLVAGIVLRRRR
ncbi:MAG: hypothetical protein LBK99_26790 [Opitutaceae bacterium]|jgi:hypothetical protein|nr:hypothetical protein [Opitutaceae bacterium]